MGMNYYTREQQTGLELHLGKSSKNWAFTLHVHPDVSLATLDDWLELLSDPMTKIRNENDLWITKDEFEKIVRERPVLHRHPVDGEFCIAHGDTWDCCLGDFS